MSDGNANYYERMEAAAYAQGLADGRAKTQQDLAAAEERGRRAGIEEAKRILADALKQWPASGLDYVLQRIAALAPRDSARCPDGDPFCACQKPMDAPRDSGPCNAVCRTKHLCEHGREHLPAKLVRP